MRASLDLTDFQRKMNNIVQYSIGFLDGAKMGKPIFLDNLGSGIIDALGTYIDISARQNPDALHHIYEWYQEGEPSSRLYDLSYTIIGSGLSFGGTFRQSQTMSKDATKPFYNKARIMEEGIPVTIVPKASSVLAFQDNGETVFTKRPVTIFNPGGDEVVGSFQKIIDEFIRNYLTQSFLRASGLYNYIEKPILYKQDFAKGAKFGRSQGVNTGYRWISNARTNRDD
jgi:hypothetical protein